MLCTESSRDKSFVLAERSRLNGNSLIQRQRQRERERLEYRRT